MNSYQCSYSSVLPTSVRIVNFKVFLFHFFHLFAFSFAISVPHNLSTILLVINGKACHCVRNSKITFGVALDEKVHDVESLILLVNFLDFHLLFVGARRFVSFILNCVVEATSVGALEEYAIERRTENSIWG